MLIGLDIGTTGCKATILDRKGNILDTDYHEYPVIHPQPEYDELDSERVWQSVIKVISTITARNSQLKIDAIASSSLGEAATPIDKEGKILHNAILYTDNRGESLLKQLVEKVGFDQIHKITGLIPHNMYTITKIMWYKKYLPEIYINTWKFLLFEDFISYKLSGKTCIDYSLASRTMAFDIRKKEWATEIIDAADIDINKLSDPLPAGSTIGPIQREIAELLHLSEDIIVVKGGWDQSCVALGVGAIESGIVADGIGSVECINIPFDEPNTNELMRKFQFPCGPHVFPNKYITIAYNITTGTLLKWFRDTFVSEEYILAKNEGKDIYEILDNRIPEEPTNLLILPFFAGAATPYFDPHATGSILGLTLTTKSIEIYRAILESTTYQIRLNVELLEEIGVKFKELRVVGGGAKSSIWLQIKSDILNRSLAVPACKEAGTIGVAILAGYAAGYFSNIEAGVRSMIKIEKFFSPKLEHLSKYNKQFERFKKIYPNLKDI